MPRDPIIRSSSCGRSGATLAAPEQIDDRTLSGTRSVAWSKKKPRLRPRFGLSMSPMLVWLLFARYA
jgi:hypothetical protein